MTKELPRDIIENNILTRLPVKSLIRFTSVSKRWRSVILHNPRFAKSQFESASKQKSITHRMLVSSSKGSLKSLDLESPWFGQGSSCCRKLHLPFEQQPPRECQLLGSCNGLVFVTFENNMFYMWNPLTGFYKKLPPLGYSADGMSMLKYFGAGYVSATDDYKVLVGYMLKEQEEDWDFDLEMVHIFSLEDHIWRTLNVDYFGDIFPYYQGMVSNEALHWVHDYSNFRFDLVAFDLAKEEFCIMQLPNLDNDNNGIWYKCMLGVVGGCLCVSGYTDAAIACESVEFWVMREYGVRDSWTKLFNLDMSNLPVQRLLSDSPCCWYAMESGTVGVKWTGNGYWFMKIDHQEKEKFGLYMIEGNGLCMVEYEESLIWIKEKENVKETKTSSPSRKKLKS